MPSGVRSQGTKFAYSDGGSPSLFVNLGNVTGGDGLGGGSAAVIDISNLDSVMKEKLMGLPDEGEMQVNLNLDPDNAGHVVMRNARRLQTRMEFRVTFVDTAPATTAVFYGYVKTFKVGFGLNKQLTCDMSIEIDGEVVWN
jgi:hypothetical protein